MPRKPVFLSQVDDHLLQAFVNAEEGVYALVGDYGFFGIQLSPDVNNRYVVSFGSKIPE
jgi:hypothetical protein